MGSGQWSVISDQFFGAECKSAWQRTTRYWPLTTGHCPLHSQKISHQLFALSSQYTLWMELNALDGMAFVS